MCLLVRVVTRRVGSYWAINLKMYISRKPINIDHILLIHSGFAKKLSIICWPYFFVLFLSLYYYYYFNFFFNKLYYYVFLLRKTK